jgi:dihydroorotate dehydrogenase
LLRALDPEAAHDLTLRALRAGLGGRQAVTHDPILEQTLWGHTFPNPVGLAAGFDKNVEVADAMLALGFGFVEGGSVTPRPQAGNPRPRLFRLPQDAAVINRMGFNNRGVAAVVERLADRKRRGILGINVGKNKETEDAAADYALGAAVLAPYADYLVCNVSSPNTPGLRALQERERLIALVGRVRAALGTPHPPLLLKIAPDLTPDDMRDIAEVAVAQAIDGLIVSNTTIARPPELRSRHQGEAGGLSGRPLFAPSTAILREMYRLTGGRLPLIGVGGIASGGDAYAKIRAGASLVQLYTALVYQGPSLIAAICRDLAARLRADGFTALRQAVGADHR